jgi:hypothetical protein
VKEVLAHSTDIGPGDERTSGNDRGLVEIDGKMMILCEMIEGSAGEHCQLDFRSCNDFDCGTNRSVAARNEDSFLARLRFFSDAVLQ